VEDREADVSAQSLFDLLQVTLNFLFMYRLHVLERVPKTLRFLNGIPRKEVK
jgi:hypothetical protein